MLRSVWEADVSTPGTIKKSKQTAAAAALVPANLDARSFIGAVVCVVTPGTPPVAHYFTGSVNGNWKQVAGALDGDEGSAIIHLPGEHPNMYLTNIRGSDTLLRNGGPHAVFAIFDKGSIAKLDSRRVRGAWGATYLHEPALDTLQMTADSFYLTFYRAALKIASVIDTKPVCVNCMAGMNRSSTSQLMYCILRAWGNPGFESPSAAECVAGVGPTFRIQKLIKYHRDMNLVGRYPVLTNPVFVTNLKKAAAFERAIHTLSDLQDWVRVRQMGRLKLVAAAFRAYAETGIVPKPPSISPAPSVAVAASVPAPEQTGGAPRLASVGEEEPNNENDNPFANRPFSFLRGDLKPTALF